MRYHDRIARIARAQNERDEAARNAAAARRTQKRRELQPEYEAVGEWQSEQIKLRGLCSEVVIETQAKLDALDAIVAAA